MKLNNLLIFFAIFFLFSGCGVKLPPEPLFPTSPTNIDNEVTRRKKENSSKNKETKQQNIIHP